MNTMITVVIPRIIATVVHYFFFHFFGLHLMPNNKRPYGEEKHNTLL
jgi:hypothetical protein